MTAIFISFLVLCFVLIGAVFGDFKCHDPLEDEEFDVPGNNVLMNLYKNSNELSNGNGDNELKQFVCDLSERYIVIGKAFDYLAQQKSGIFRISLSPKKKSAENQKSAKNKLSPSIRACMIEEFELLKTVDELDRPMAQLIYKLYKSISALKHPIIAGSSGQNAKIQKLNEEIVQTTFFLAERLEIPKKQIEPKKNEKQLDQDQSIKELGELWFLYRKTWKYGKKDYEKRKRENRKHAKRMLQLVINFSTDGVDGLANLKSEKKSQRRRRKRGNAKTAAVIIIFVVFLCALSVLVMKHHSSEHLAKKQQQQQEQQRDIVVALSAHGAAVDELKTLSLEHVEQPVPEQQRKHNNRKEDSKKLHMRREQSLNDQREQAEHGDILCKSIMLDHPRTSLNGRTTTLPTTERVLLAAKTPPKTEPVRRDAMSNDQLDVLIDKLLRTSRQEFTLLVSPDDIRQLCKTTTNVLKKQPSLAEIQPPLVVCGDIHGQFSDLKRIFAIDGLPSEKKYLFLGDIVDRGSQSLETAVLLLAYKARYPKSCFLLRGNHECRGTNQKFGFYNEIATRYGQQNAEEIWMLFNNTFAWLPYAGLIGKKFLCMHGGISHRLNSLEQLRQLRRPQLVHRTNSLEHDLLWSDPKKGIQGVGQGPRGSVFGEDVVHRVCQELKVDLIVRAHQCVPNGTKYFASNRLLTIFSAPGYGRARNVSATMSVDKNFVRSFNFFPPSKRNVLKHD